MAEPRNEKLDYLEKVLEELGPRGLVELVFLNHMVGGLSAIVDDYEWRACVDAALKAALRQRAMGS